MNFLENGIWNNHLEIASYIAKGIIVTLEYTILSVFFGFIISMLLTILRETKLAFFSKFYVSVFRGVPLMVQLMVIHYAVPPIIGIKFDVFTSGLLSFSLNSGAYVTEILKSGIQSIDKGQFEAARALRIPNLLIWKDIIMPQVLRNVIPSLLNELTAMVKETSLIAILGAKDIMQRSKDIMNEHYILMEPLLIAGVYYYIIVSFISLITKLVEKKYDIS